MSELDHILADIQASAETRAQRRQWEPRNAGQIDIRIARNGDWYHEGRRFQREAMVKLFAGILRREDDDYYLVTPAEKLAIEVEDAPFVATLVERLQEGDTPAIVFTTNIGERVLLDNDHGLRIDIDDRSGEPRPYLQLHDGLEALISRSAFYDLVNLAEEKRLGGTTCLVVTSMGQEFNLGTIDE